MPRLNARKAVASSISGILMAFAMPGFGFVPLAFICLVPLFYAIAEETRLRRRLVYGLLFGVTFFALDQRWILTLYRFSPLVVPGFILAVFFLGLFFGLFAAAMSPSRRGRMEIQLLLIAPAAFTLLEMARAQGPLGTGFSMLYTSLYHLPVMIRIAPLLGSWAITALIVLVNASLYLALRRRRASYALIGLASLAALLLPALVPVPPAGESVRVAIVSSTVQQEVKLDARNLPELTARYVDLGEEAIAQDVDLVVFPESILPAFILSDQSILGQLQDLATEGSAQILFGTGVYERPLIRNEVALLDETGDLVGTYAMVRPVPFGETIPGRRIWEAIGLKGLMDSFLPLDLTPGTSYAPVGGIGTPICFESSFPDGARGGSRLGADLLAVVTNDAWFVGSSELYAHFASAVFRAVETGRDLIQAANGGVSGLINARGRILTETTVETVTVGELHRRTGQTLYVRMGDWPLVIILSLALGMGLLLNGKGCRRGHPEVAAADRDPTPK